MPESAEKKSMIAGIGSVIGVISGILGIFVTLKACNTKPPAPPVSHEIDGYWSSPPGDYMRVLYLSVDSAGLVSGKMNQPCILPSELDKLDAYNPTREYAVDSGAVWDGKNLQFDWGLRADTFTGALEDGKLVGVDKSNATEIDLHNTKYKIPETSSDLEFTRGKQGCVTSLDVRTDADLDLDKDYPIEGYWHSNQAQLHIINIKADGTVTMTETYPCMENAKGSTINEATTKWDGTTLKFVLPPIVAQNWDIDGNVPQTFTIRKVHGRLAGRSVSSSGSYVVHYQRGKIVCENK